MWYLRSPDHWGRSCLTEEKSWRMKRNLYKKMLKKPFCLLLNAAYCPRIICKSKALHCGDAFFLFSVANNIASHQLSQGSFATFKEYISMWHAARLFYTGITSVKQVNPLANVIMNCIWRFPWNVSARAEKHSHIVFLNVSKNYDGQPWKLERKAKRFQVIEIAQEYLPWLLRALEASPSWTFQVYNSFLLFFAFRDVLLPVQSTQANWQSILVSWSKDGGTES